MTERIVLIGAGRTSGPLIGRLARVAPLTVVDLSAPALQAVKASADADGGTEHPIRTLVADGSSRLVLEDLRGDAKDAAGLVVITGQDRATIEICRLGAELGYRPIVCVVNDGSARARCDEIGARSLVKSQVLGQMVEEALHQGGVGATMATSVGLGKGEILEFRVLPSSPAIGVPLAELHAERWRVAAIYRGDELVLPTGKTQIAAEDRVIVIGDPTLLPHVAESLRLGLPTFPLMHGPNVVVYLPRGRDRDIEEEADLLARTTRAEGLVRLFPGAEPARTFVEGKAADVARKSFEDVALPSGSLSDHVTSLRARRPGVIVARSARRGLEDVLLGLGGRDGRLCNELEVPVLFPAGSSRYARVVLGVSREIADLGVAEIALDVARIFEVPFVVLRIRPPSHLGEASPEVEALVASIEQRARLHGKPAEVVLLEGNPVARIVATAQRDDLLVLARPRRRRDTFAAPDVALRVVRSARSSVMVCTVGAA